MEEVNSERIKLLVKLKIVYHTETTSMHGKIRFHLLVELLPLVNFQLPYDLPDLTTWMRAQQISLV